MQKILITGGAGFIGFYISNLLVKNNVIYSIDNINSYYSKKIKLNRIKKLKNNKNFFFKKIDVRKTKTLIKYLKNKKINLIIHLAAQAGVIKSISHPNIYFKSNIEGFYSILEVARILQIPNLIYASSSSIYGEFNNEKLKEDKVNKLPKNFYGFSKYINENFAKFYKDQHKINSVGLRFFTVYGALGRPDMSYKIFFDSILKGKTIKLYNYGNNERDFTYIDDLLAGIKYLVKNIGRKPFKNFYNIGSSRPIKIIDLLKEIELNLKKEAKIKLLPARKFEVNKTYANIDNAKKDLNLKKITDFKKGIKKFVENEIKSL